MYTRATEQCQNAAGEDTAQNTKLSHCSPNRKPSMWRQVASPSPYVLLLIAKAMGGLVPARLLGSSPACSSSSSSLASSSVGSSPPLVPAVQRLHTRNTHTTHTHTHETHTRHTHTTHTHTHTHTRHTHDTHTTHTRHTRHTHDTHTQSGAGECLSIRASCVSVCKTWSSPAMMVRPLAKMLVVYTMLMSIWRLQKGGVGRW